MIENGQVRSTTGWFRLVAQLYQLIDYFIAMVALDLDIAFLDCAPGSAFLLQILAQCSQIFRGELQITHDGDRFASAPFTVAKYTRVLLLWR